MKTTIIDDIINKINEYNLGLLSEYKTEDNGHCFVTPRMIVFFDEVDQVLSVAFQADQKPEDVATNILILKEIESIKNIKIMDSFVYDNNKNYISGEEAFKLIKQSILSQAILEAFKENTYKQIMMNTKAYEC